MFKKIKQVSLKKVVHCSISREPKFKNTTQESGRFLKRGVTFSEILNKCGILNVNVLINITLSFIDFSFLFRLTKKKIPAAV